MIHIKIYYTIIELFVVLRKNYFWYIKIWYGTPMFLMVFNENSIVYKNSITNFRKCLIPIKTLLFMISHWKYILLFFEI